MNKRYIQYGIGGAVVVAILAGVLMQSMETTVFFHTPAEVLAAPRDFRHKTIRIGALVEKESTQWDAERVRLSFRVTEDSQHFIPVEFAGVKPDMYREGQGVVVEGQMDERGIFQATNVLVKHSEEYSVDEGKVRDMERAYRSLVQDKAAKQ